MALRLEGMISGWGRSAGAVIPALGSGRYSPGPKIVLPSWHKGSDPHCTLNVFWGQPGALATVSINTGLYMHCTTAIIAVVQKRWQHAMLTLCSGRCARGGPWDARRLSPEQRMGD